MKNTDQTDVFGMLCNILKPVNNSQPIISGENDKEYLVTYSDGNSAQIHAINLKEAKAKANFLKRTHKYSGETSVRLKK